MDVRTVAPSASASDYLREEVAAEALVRNVPIFADVLNAAALSDTETVNTSDGILILPPDEFCRRLNDGAFM